MEHLDHEIEHHEHAAHNPFDKKVAMTMAVVAATLACVTMLSHRAHNDTLRLQTEANIAHTKATDQWNFFQAQKIRQHMYEINAESQSTTSADAAKRSEDWRKKAERYKDKADEIEKEARALVSEAEKHMDESHHVHHRADRFDYGELGIELALVLCSVAVLTKQRGFWFAGIVSAVIGACVAGSAFLMH